EALAVPAGPERKIEQAAGGEGAYLLFVEGKGLGVHFQDVKPPVPGRGQVRRKLKKNLAQLCFDGLRGRDRNLFDGVAVDAAERGDAGKTDGAAAAQGVGRNAAGRRRPAGDPRKAPFASCPLNEDSQVDGAAVDQGEVDSLLNEVRSRMHVVI